MYIKRELAGALEAMAKQFPVVAVMGPRQSGKTTLARHTFPDYTYVSLEDLDRRAAANQDPRGFFASYATAKGLIIDEIQQVPDLFSYLQGIVDEQYRPGFFIVTGSQHFLMHEKISQTLAGRVALLTLLPLSAKELAQAGLLQSDSAVQMLQGFYPRPYAQPIDRAVWCANYISTYIEKDVRQVINITDLVSFQRFLKLCAARVGNIINYADLARDADISPNTAKAWLSILEASYIVKFLYPYHRNFNKRVIKSPKLYFYDTALVCSLLGITSAEDLRFHPFKGALFESFALSEIYKYIFNANKIPSLYYWRDVQGHEIDIIIERAIGDTVPIEIKAGMTIMPDFFKGLKDWDIITQQLTDKAYVVYAGQQNLVQGNSYIFAWTNVADLMKEIYFLR